MYVEDQQRISHSEVEKDIGSIPSHNTKEVIIDVFLNESDRYNVDAILFEDGEKIVSSQSAFTSPTPPSEESTGGSFPTGEKKDSDEGSFEGPGFSGKELILIIIIILIIINVKARIKKYKK
jgi:hypothetical protein